MKINSYAEFQGNEPCMRNFRICVSEYPPPLQNWGFTIMSRLNQFNLEWDSLKIVLFMLF